MNCHRLKKHRTIEIQVKGCLSPKPLCSEMYVKEVDRRFWPSLLKANLGNSSSSGRTQTSAVFTGVLSLGTPARSPIKLLDATGSNSTCLHIASRPLPGPRTQATLSHQDHALGPEGKRGRHLGTWRSGRAQKGWSCHGTPCECRRLGAARSGAKVLSTTEARCW